MLCILIKILNKFLDMRSVELASNPPKKGVIRAELHIMLILFEEC